MPAKWKLTEVEEITKKLTESPIVAVASIRGIPSKQFQQIRHKLKGTAEIKVVKNSLAARAFEVAKTKRKGLDELEDSITGPSALIFSEENPFKLYKNFEDNTIPSVAKPGDIAPYDIIIPAGDTPFKPGPIIGDLQKVGIKAKIQGGVIAVVADSPVAKKGEEISKDLASVLSRMEVEPMHIGVNIRAVYEEGLVYGGDILHIDRAKVFQDFADAHSKAFALCIEAEIFNDESVKYFISDAVNKARNLSIEAGIVNKESLGYLLSKASSQAATLNSVVTGEPLPTAAPVAVQTAPAEEKEEKSEEKSEEDVAAGLGSLFD
jgi:large subunit ribosomal protein L10